MSANQKMNDKNFLTGDAGAQACSVYVYVRELSFGSNICASSSCACSSVLETVQNHDINETDEQRKI
jgi:exosome complex RNA-binding protein Rrp42 (RNase PH superfamily)